MCHVWSIILVACTIVPFVRTVSPVRTPSRPGKEAAGTSEVPQSIMGVFKTTGAPISTKECEGHCKTHFGDIIPSPERPESRFPMTQPSVSADKKTCSCLLNTEKISDYVVKKNFNYNEFLHWGQTATFCSGRVWLSMNRAKVEIRYEQEARKVQRQGSPTETSKGPVKTTKGTAGTSRDPKKTTKDAAGTLQGPTGSAKAAAGTSEEPKIIMGVFTTTGTAFTAEGCKVNCRTTFGYIVPYPGVRIPFAEPSVSADRKTCSCLLNIEPIRDYCIEAGRDYEELFKSCRKSYCHCKVWFEDASVNVEIQYEVAARGTQKKKGGTIKKDEKRPMGDVKDGPGNPEEKILMATLKDVGAVNPENCKVQCNMKFGFIVPYPTNRIRITVANVATDKEKLVCQCFLNIEPIREYFIEKDLDYESFFKQCRIFYYGYRKWLADHNINVKMPETEQSPGPTVTPKSPAGTSKGPTRS